MVATYVPGPHGPMVFSIGSAAPSASAWDPSGHGTDITLSTTSIANDTATISASQWNAVRGTASHTTGKWAFEIILLVSNSEIVFGLLDQTTAGGAGLTNTLTAANGFGQWEGNSFFQSGADFSGSSAGSWVPATNDIYGVQADLTSGKVWFSRNGTSLSGNPVAGTGNTGAIANNHLVCPSAYIITNTTKIQLVTGTLNFPVSGFSSWG